MSALDYILLNDPSDVEIEQKEIPRGGPSIVLRTEHVRTAKDLESVSIQPIVDSSSAKKQHAPTRRSTRETSSPNVAPQSSYPISVDSGDEDDANVITSDTGVKLVKKEVLEASGGAGDAPGQHISIVLKKLNETKRIVPEKAIQVKGGSSKPTSHRGGVSGEVEKEPVSSVVVEENKKKEKVEEKVEMVLNEKCGGCQGEGTFKANLPIFVPQWNIRTSDTTKSSEVCHDMLKNMATHVEKEALSKLSDEDSAYRNLRLPKKIWQPFK
ncbi:hypothetical protein Hanom_Chr16g01424511 [Helianthus anomalus]